MWEQLEKWDRDLFVYLNSFGVDNHDEFWIFVTKIEHWIPLYLLFFSLFFVVYDKRKAIQGILITILTFGVTLAITGLTKYYVGRLRPNNTPELSDLIRILQTPNTFSFFSGHAAVSFAITTFIVMVFRNHYKWVYIFYIWPLLFITSRILVGVHYPLDILIGSLVGVLIAFIIWKFLGKRLLVRV